MSGDTGDQLGPEEPQVWVRTRVVRRGEALRVTTDPLRSALREAERRFLTAQRDAAGGTSPDALSEYRALLADLGAIDEGLEEASGRRDISYLTDRRLNLLKDYSSWLARRVGTEFLLVLQVRLEQELKRLIGPESYRMFLHFQEVEDVAREVEALSDQELMARVREGTLFREILGQVRLGEILGQRSNPGRRALAADIE